MLKFISLSSLFFLFFIIHNAYSQNQDVKQIENTFYKYINSIQKDDFKSSLNYINADFFKHVSKDEFLKSLQAVNSSDKIKYNLSNAKIKKIEPLTKIKNQYYTTLTYSSLVSLKFSPIKPARTQEQELNIIKKSFEKNNTKAEVSFNKDTDSYQFTENKKVCVTSIDDKKSWQFLIIDGTQKDFLTKILPQEIINKF